MNNDEYFNYLLGYGKGYEEGSSGGGGSLPTPTSWNEYLDIQQDLLYNFTKGIRATYNNPIYLYDTAKTLYTPDAEFKTYLIRLDKGTYNIVWFKEKVILCCNNNSVTYPGVLSFNNFNLSTFTRNGDNNIKFTNNQYMQYEYYMSSGFTSYEDAIAGILSNTTSYGNKNTGSGIGTQSVSSEAITTNTFFIYPMGDHTFTYRVRQVSANENIVPIA